MTSTTPHPAIIAAAGALVAHPEDRPWWHADAGDTRCRCKRAMPTLAGYRFTFSDGSLVTLRVGQCAVCQAVWWREG